MAKKIALLVLIVASLVLSSCVASASQSGVLEGKVTIGPLQPVERSGMTPPTPPEVYQARKILVYDEDGRLLHTVDIDNTGSYRVELGLGSYTVDINHVGLDRSSDVPKEVEIKSGQTVKLDIAIDTGLR